MSNSLRVVGAGSRSCGDCTACCTLAAVEELGKPEFSRCSNLGDRCDIYDDRPQSCRDWGCMWYHGYLEDRDRPDKSGIMILPNKEGFARAFGAQVVSAREVSRSAARMPRGEKAIKRLTRSGVSLIFKDEDGGMKIYPGGGAERLFHALLRKMGKDYSWRGKFFSVNP